MDANVEKGCGSKDDNEEEPLDPRVKVELEILNQCSSDVNQLEREIDEARNKYQQNFSVCSMELEKLKKKFGASIKKARLYYELKEKACEAQSEALRSARKFQSANGIYRAAKETISLAELRLMDDKAASLSSAWQEMLNHALSRVVEAEKEKTASEKEHLSRAAAFAEIEQQLCIQEKRQKRSIAKARVYFETKKGLEIKLQQVKQSIHDLQQALVAAKGRYSGALRRLEEISDCIHEKRRHSLVLMYPREPGVGAEEEGWTEDKLPTLSSCDVDKNEENDDFDDYEDEDYDDDDDYDGIDSDSVFRARVLTTSLDEEDTSFVRRTRSGKKQLKRSRSLPVNASEMARRHKRLEPLTPLSDRSEACPPDGESIGSGTSVGAGSVSSVTSHGPAEQFAGSVSSVTSHGPAEQLAGSVSSFTSHGPAEQFAGGVSSVTSHGPAEQLAGSVSTVTSHGPAEQFAGSVSSVPSHSLSEQLSADSLEPDDSPMSNLETGPEQLSLGLQNVTISEVEDSCTVSEQQPNETCDSEVDEDMSST